MRFGSFAKVLPAAVGILLLTGAAQADLITNGSFESVTGGNIDNWTLTPTAASGDSASYTGTSPYGPKFLVFNPGAALPAGSATQDFGGVTLGQQYEVTFAFGQFNSSQTTDVQSLLVTINQTSAPLFTQTYTDPTPTNDLGTLWERISFTFLATGIPSGITFTNTGTLGFTNSDLLVDDVAINLVPEPFALGAVVFGAAAMVRPARRRRA